MATQVFSEAELERLRGFPELDSDELIRFFTLTPSDEAFVRSHRGSSNHLGVAVQLCTLPWLGFVPDDIASAPTHAIQRVAEHLRISPSAISSYAARDQTRTDHLVEVAKLLGWRPAGDVEFKELDQFLVARALEHDSPTLLFRLACDYLRSARVIRPGLPTERRRFLATIGRRSTAQALSRRDPERRYPILLTLLAQCAVEVLDEVVQLYDQAVSATDHRAERKLEEKLASRAKASEDRLGLLDEVLSVLTNPDIADEAVGALLRSGIGMERLRRAREAAPRRLPPDHGHLEMVEGSYAHLREFAPAVLAAIPFDGATAARPLLSAVKVLVELNATGARMVPDDAPDEFVPTRWRGYLERAAATGDVTAYRHYWELCVLLALRDGLRCGDVFVPGSRRYADPASLLFTPEQWEPKRAEFFALVGKSPDAARAWADTEAELHRRLADLEATLASGAGPIRLSEGGELVIPPLSAESVPTEADTLRDELVALLPRPRLASLLIELDNRIGFTEAMVHAGGKTARSPELVRNIYACLIAQATNLGLHGMAEASGIPYEVLAWTAEWYLREDTLRAANALIVNYHHGLALAAIQGGGTLSSSDGQRFPTRGRSITARAMSRYFVDEGVSTYTYVSDQLSTYGTKVIVVTEPEATSVLDEILGNQTDLPIAEHATDTAGATLVNFALFDLVDLLFSPRIRDLGKITLCRTDTKAEALALYPRAGPLLSRRANEALIRGSVGRPVASGRVAQVRAHHRLAGGGQAVGVGAPEHAGGGAEGVRAGAAHHLRRPVPLRPRLPAEDHPPAEQGREPSCPAPRPLLRPRGQAPSPPPRGPEREDPVPHRGDQRHRGLDHRLPGPGGGRAQGRRAPDRRRAAGPRLAGPQRVRRVLRHVLDRGGPGAGPARRRVPAAAPGEAMTGAHGAGGRVHERTGRTRR